MINSFVVMSRMNQSNTLQPIHAALSCSWVKLPTKVMKVRMAMGMNAVRVRCPLTYDFSLVSAFCVSLPSFRV